MALKITTMIPGFTKNRLAFSLLLILLISLVMCNKDEYNPDKDFRIIQTKSYTDDLLYEIADYHYSEDKIVLIERKIPPMHGWPEMYNKTEVSYPHGDSVVTRKYLEYNGLWEYFSMVINEIQEDKIIRQSFAEGGLEKIRNVYEYQYTGNQLSVTIMNIYDNPYQKITYEYQGSDLVRRFNYNYAEDWVLNGIDTVYYNGNEVDSLIGYSITDGIRSIGYKDIYSVEDGLFIMMDHFEADSNSWRHNGHYEYKYNSHKDLSSRSYEIGGTVYKTDYYYEAGKGNEWQVVTNPIHYDIGITSLP